MRAKWLTALTITGLVSVLISCTQAPGGGGGPVGGATPTPDAGATQTPSQAVTEIVTVKDMTFSPATVTIPAGSTVVWKFQGPSPHSTTSDAGSAKAWDSGILGSGATYTVKFDQPGTYPYHCTPHQSMGMVGTVIVQ